jgi:erythromycin esterase
VVLLSCTDPATAQEVESRTLLAQEQAIVAWVRQSALPLRHIEAGNGFADLQPLKRVLTDVRIVGLGEATHGTRENFQLKHRLIEFLVTEMGFTVVAMEVGYAGSQPINEYILHGRGDRASVLSGQGYVVWDTEEFSATLDWLRAYNQTVPDDRKVRFYGLDLFFNDVGRAEVLAYLTKTAPERVPTADSLFRVLAVEDAKRPVADKDVLASALPALQELTNFLTENKATLVGRSSGSQFEHAFQYVQVMKQGIMMTTNADRSQYMADNLSFILEHDRPSAKAIIWAHNIHVGKGSRAPGSTDASIPYEGYGAPFMGHRLRRQYGNQYYSFGDEFYQGSYQSRIMPPNEPAADLKEVVVSPAPVRSFPWYLARANIGDFILDLRTPSGNPSVDQWLSTPQVVHYGSWAYRDPDAVYRQANIRDEHDGILFVERTTATRPTPNALRSVASRKGI